MADLSFPDDFQGLELVYVDLDAFQVAQGNAKNHDLGDLITSFREFGFRDPIGEDGYAGGLTAEGHGRLQALMTMKNAGEAAPDYIYDDGDGHWYVPTVKGFASANEAQFRAYRIRHNRSVILGGWDEGTLAAELTFLAGADKLELSGFDGDDLNLLSPNGDDDSRQQRSAVEWQKCPQCGYKWPK